MRGFCDWSSPGPVVLSDLFRDRSSKIEHWVENVDTDHCLGMLSVGVTRFESRTDDALISRHRGLDQGASMIARYGSMSFYGESFFSSDCTLPFCL